MGRRRSFAARARLATTYASFTQHAWNEGLDTFRNFMSYERVWLEDRGAEDTFGRTVWSLALTSALGPPRLRHWAASLLDHVVVASGTLHSPRARAWTMVGLCAVAPSPRPRLAGLGRDRCAARALMAAFQRNRRSDWPWFEKVLAYDNARLPQALLAAGAVLEQDAMRAVALESLEWLCAIQTAEQGHFRPVGMQSFGRAYAPPLPYDQQPIEAEQTPKRRKRRSPRRADVRWLEEARRAYRWFLGDNDQNLPIAEEATGRCYDGLGREGVNLNQGAESVVAFGLATCAASKRSQAVRASNVRFLVH